MKITSKFHVLFGAFDGVSLTSNQIHLIAWIGKTKFIWEDKNTICTLYIFGPIRFAFYKDIHAT